MQACTLTFATRSGTGTQTITGVVDAAGSPFVGKVFLFHGNSTLNSVETFYRRTVGFDSVGVAVSVGIEEADPFGIKLLCYGESGLDSVFSEHSQVFFGGAVWRTAYIQSVGSGTFTLNYTLNVLTGDSYSVTVLGGDDLSVILNGLSSTSFTSGFQPDAAIFSSRGTAFGDPATTGSVGSIGYGWAVRTGEQSASQMNVVDQGGNVQYQRTNKCYAILNASSVVRESAVNSWNATGFTLDVAPVKAGVVAVGGIHSAAGTITQPASSGAQVVTVGFLPRIVLLSSVGAAASSVIQTGIASWTLGMMDSARQNVYWCAENKATAAPLNGARYLGSGNVLVFGTPAGLGTTFSASASRGAFSSTGFTLNWGAVDGVSREINWLALGDEAPTPPPVDVGCFPTLWRDI